MLEPSPMVSLCADPVSKHQRRSASCPRKILHPFGWNVVRDKTPTKQFVLATDNDGTAQLDAITREPKSPDPWRVHMLESQAVNKRYAMTAVLSRSPTDGP